MFSFIYFDYYICIVIPSLIVSYVMSKNVSKYYNNSADYEMDSKIIGGKPVPIENYPASVKVYNLGSLCSGTIINSWCVLTAAHCFDHNQVVYDMMVEVGARYINDRKSDIYTVIKVVIHEEYNKIQPFACDVALIFVPKPIKLGAKAKKALLVKDTEWMKADVKNLLVAGWGWTKYGGPISKMGLMETRLRFVPSAECERLHQLRLSPDMFCLYGDGARDTCKGDSGGGVFWNKTVIGVVSHGDGCAKRNKPSVYANVWYFRSWIRAQLEHFFETACDILPSELTLLL